MSEQTIEPEAKPEVPEILSERTVCEVLGISAVTAWRLRKARKLGYCTYAGKIVYLPRHIEEFLAAREVRAKGAQESTVEEWPALRAAG